MKLLLASKLARFAANIFEIVERGMGRGGEQSPQPCEGAACTCRIAKISAGLFGQFEKRAHFVQIETAERRALFFAQ